jgi:hypothetical protein
MGEQFMKKVENSTKWSLDTADWSLETRLFLAALVAIAYLCAAPLIHKQVAPETVQAAEQHRISQVDANKFGAILQDSVSGASIFCSYTSSCVVLPPAQTK